MSELTEARIQASILHKQLRSPERDVATAAAQRLRRLASLARYTSGQLVATPELVRRAHALTVVALERGFPSWTAFLHARAERDVERGRAPAGPRVDTDRFFHRPMSAFWNRWFATYAEARASLEREGGFLFPYRHQFFVCEAGFVAALGADPSDPDWARIGHDWVEPADADAYRRLTIVLVGLGFGSWGEGTARARNG